jgi:hypothetical protein
MSRRAWTLPPALAAVAASVLMTAGLPTAGGHYPPGPVHPCPGGTNAVERKGPWTTIRTPAPLTQLVTHAAGGLDGKVVLASDGRKVMRSNDGGCTWSESFDIEISSLPGEGRPAGGSAPSVAAVTFPAGRGQAFLLLDGVGRAAASRLLTSQDGGATWEQSGRGLPAASGFRDLVGAPSDAKTLYLTAGVADAIGDNDPAGATGLLYGSDDGGASWTLRSTGPQIDRVVVDPLAPRTLYAVRATHAVQRSTDGGRTWLGISIRAGDSEGGSTDTSWRDIAVDRVPGRPATIVVVASPTRIASVSRVVASVDGGNVFVELPTNELGPVSGVSFGSSPSQLIFVAGSDSSAFRGPGLLLFDLGQQRWRDVDDLSLVSLREPRAFGLDPATRGHEGLRALELRRDAPGADPPLPDLIARYTPPDPPPGDPNLLNRPLCNTAGTSASQAPTAASAARFEPATLDVALEPGTPHRLPIAAELGAVPSPLDVYYLINSSESMDPAIAGVTCSALRLADALGEKGVDGWFGVGTYSDRYEERYSRRLDLSPPGPPLRDALDHLYTRRGIEDPIRSALYQTATGAGLETTDTDVGGTSVTVTVPPGQQASYRDQALHTVLVIADAPYSETMPGEPSREEIVAALRKKGILAIGIVVVPSAIDSLNRRNGRTPEKTLLLRQQLDYFARESGAVAPRGGVDCDGGGTPDLQAGDPLVCQVDERGIQASMGPTLLTILRGLQDIQDLKLVPTKTSGLAVSVEGGVAERVDVKHPSQLAGTAVIACTAAQAGRRFSLEFAVQAGSRTVGTLAGAARCGEEPKPTRKEPDDARTPAAPAQPPSKAAPAIPAPPTPNPGVAIAPPPPPPSPAPASPAPTSAPASAPATAASPSAAASPAPGQAAVAPEPVNSTAPQAATVRTGGDGSSTQEHSMVAVRSVRRDEAAAATPALITLGLGFCGALGWLVLASERRRRHAVPARVGDRR